MFDPITMLAAFGPTLVKVGEAALQRFAAPSTVKPVTVEDAVALGKLENEKLQILTSADSSGDTYQWIEAIRKLQRPVVVFSTLAAFLYNPAQPIVAEVFQSVMWYLFGERVTVYFNKQK